MEDMDIITKGKPRVAEIYFTPEVLQALGVEGEVVLHYGVFDFSVQLHKFFDHQVSVMLEAGEFFQKMVASREEKVISLCVQMYNKEFTKDTSSVNFIGTLQSVEQHELAEGDNVKTFMEINISLDDKALESAGALLNPLISAVEAYQCDENICVTLGEDEVKESLISLRFSTIHLGDDQMMRCLPNSFSKDCFSFYLKKDTVEVDQEVEIHLVLLKHQINVSLFGRVTEKKGDFTSVEEVFIEFTTRPPLAYILFLNKLKYYHK